MSKCLCELFWVVKCSFGVESWKLKTSGQVQARVSSKEKPITVESVRKLWKKHCLVLARPWLWKQIQSFWILRLLYKRQQQKKNPCFAECKFRKTLGILQWIGFHLNNPWGKIHRTKADKRPNHLQIWAMAAILSLHNKHVLGWKHAVVSQAGFNVRP